MNETTSTTESGKQTAQPTLKLKFLSHGTLESKDLDFTRKFYEEFLGLEVVRASKVSIWCRLGGAHIYVVVQVPEGKKAEMPFLNHNGIDVETEDEVDECHRLAVRDAAIWNLRKISKPMCSMEPTVSTFGTRTIIPGKSLPIPPAATRGC